MICPACQEQGLRSTVQTNGQRTTLMGYPEFYDEEGKYHKHDNNSVTTIGKCSNGHIFTYRYKTSCWCGWVGKEEEYEMLEPKPEPTFISTSKFPETKIKIWAKK